MEGGACDWIATRQSVFPFEMGVLKLGTHFDSPRVYLQTDSDSKNTYVAGNSISARVSEWIMCGNSVLVLEWSTMPVHGQWDSEFGVCLS